MRSTNQLPGGPSLRLFAGDKDKEKRSPPPPGANSGATRAGPSKASRLRLRPHLEVVGRAKADDGRATGDSAFRIIKAIGGLARRGTTAFARVLLAAISWTVVQILTGCAEYCQAMYPTFVEPDEPVKGHDATDGSRSGQRVAARLSGQETAAGGMVTPLHRRRFDPTSVVNAEAARARAAHAHAVHQALARLAANRIASRGWRLSIRSAVAEFWLRLRHERETRRAIMALRALKDPALRDAEMTRHRTEYFASLGNHCE